MAANVLADTKLDIAHRILFDLKDCRELTSAVKRVQFFCCDIRARGKTVRTWGPMPG